MRGRVTGFLAFFALAACDDGGSTADQEAPEVDMAVVAPDAATPDPDAATPDVYVPPPHLAEPQANVFLDDPITDDWTTEVVTLHETTTEDGTLTSPWVSVFNCLNEDGGIIAMPMIGNFQLTVQMCHEVKTALPGPDGHYTHIVPPFLESDPNDVFSEVQMYHHVNVVHDYFKDVHGLTELDYPLNALVNVQVKLDPPLPIPGFEAGPDGWVQLPNAAFFPEESWAQFAAQFGLPPREGDLIFFGQAAADFAYDARVIYHEYSHAVVGTERLQAAAVPDAWGLDNSSASMNEGLADYFAATLADGPQIGLYGIGALQPSLVRYLDDPRRCPDDLADEIHAQGRIIGSTLWAVREALGAETTDAIAFAALEQMTVTTTHDGAAELMLAEAEARGVVDEVRAVFEDFGFGGCARSLEWTDWSGATSRDRLPHVVEGTGSGGLAGFRDGVPAYKQFWIDVPEGTAGVELGWVVGGGGGAIGGLGGSPRPIDLAIRKDDPIAFTYLGGVQMAHDQLIDAPADGTRQTVVLTGDCLPEPGGRLHTIFLNPNDNAMNVLSMRVELLDEISDADAAFDCAAED